MGRDGYVGVFVDVDGVRYAAGEVVASTWGGVQAVCASDVAGGVGSAMAGIAVGLESSSPFQNLLGITWVFAVYQYPAAAGDRNFMA